MITTNIDKKTLVEKLLKGSMVTIDEAFMLLDESAPIQMPYIIPQPVYPQYPYYQGPWWGIYPPATVNDFGSYTDVLVTSSVTDVSVMNSPFYAGSTLTFN